MNICEIAKKAGVSRATVSRVLNHVAGVKEETRRRVEQVIEETNYIPSAAARSLASRKSNTIGVLIYNITQPFWAGVISGIEDGVSQTDYGLFFTNSKSHVTAWDYQKRYKQSLRSLVRRGVDGIIIAVLDDLDKEDIDFLESTGIPYTVLQNHLDDPRIVSVSADNVQASFDATNYLIGMGHRSIVHVSGPMLSSIARQRLQGYTMAMEQAGIGVSDGDVIGGSFKFNEGYWAMKQILSRPQRPTAVLFGCDLEAFGGIAAAREEKVEIPEEISVMGFDGIAKQLDHRALLPELTTMRQPVDKLGLAAARMLIDQLEGRPLEKTRVDYKMEFCPGKTVSSLKTET